MQSHPHQQPSSSSANIQKPSVVDLISTRKAAVLRGCTIVFSSMIPFGHDPEKSELWAMAREFGATPSAEIQPGVTTHVVAARPGTAKVHQALRLAKSSKLEVVWPSWFHVSASRWARQDEGLYRISASENSLASASAAAEAAGAEAAKPETQESSAVEKDKAEPTDKADADETLFENELNDMDWGAAADEVDAYLDSATTASNTSSPSPSMLATDPDLPDIDAEDAQTNDGSSRKRARVDEGDADTSKKRRPDAEEEQGDEDEDDDDGGDSFLDDLAEELDGQLDNE
ncbi:hypothetical protein [Sporisorium scitamineum]|nr:hypothetical protein [Sporisorium scitamineum]